MVEVGGVENRVADGNLAASAPAPQRRLVSVGADAPGLTRAQPGAAGRNWAQLAAARSALRCLQACVTLLQRASVGVVAELLQPAPPAGHTGRVQLVDRSDQRGTHRVKPHEAEHVTFQ